MMSYFAADKDLLWPSGSTSETSRLCFSRDEGSNPHVGANKCVEYYRFNVIHLRMSTNIPFTTHKHESIQLPHESGRTYLFLGQSRPDFSVDQRKPAQTSANQL
jgi:hypothetical protein